MDSMKIQVSDVSGRGGVYDLYELFEGDKINVTAQGLLDIAAWVEEHRAKLEQESDVERELDRKFWEHEAKDQAAIAKEWRDYRLEGDESPPTPPSQLK